VNLDPIQKSYTYKYTDFTELLRKAIISDESDKGYLPEVVHDNPNGTITIHFTSIKFMREVHTKERKKLMKKAFLE